MNLVFFFSPSQVAANEAPQGRAFRIGGLVEEGSVKRETDGLTVRFIVTDTAKTIPVAYTGILPDLFKEGKGVVAQGKLGADGVFRAPARCWPSTTRTTCRRKPPTRSRRRSKAQTSKPSARLAAAARRPMIPEIGHFALILALLLGAGAGHRCRSSAPRRGIPRLDGAGAARRRRASSLFVAIAFGCLAWSFVSNDFSVLNVATNSNSQLPLQYRIAAHLGLARGLAAAVGADALAAGRVAVTLLLAPPARGRWWRACWA